MSFKKHVNIFAKAQASALIGGLTDYFIMIALTELLFLHYTVSIVLSGTIGAVINFSLNRHWTYGSTSSPIRKQLVKFSLVVAGSIMLKSYGTYLFTNTLVIDYKISRIITDILVSIGYNFILQKYWVFREKPVPAIIEAIELKQPVSL